MKLWRILFAEKENKTKNKTTVPEAYHIEWSPWVGGSLNGFIHQMSGWKGAALPFNSHSFAMELLTNATKQAWLASMKNNSSSLIGDQESFTGLNGYFLKFRVCIDWLLKEIVDIFMSCVGQMKELLKFILCKNWKNYMGWIVTFWSLNKEIINTNVSDAHDKVVMMDIL